MNVRKYGGKLLIKPARENVQAFLRKVRELVNGNKALRHDALIRLLNPVLQGWANYYRCVVGKADLCKGQSCYLTVPMALGAASASEQKGPGGLGKSISDRWCTSLGLCGGNWQETS
jgi:hypothetical protein